MQKSCQVQLKNLAKSILIQYVVKLYILGGGEYYKTISIRRLPSKTALLPCTDTKR